MPEIRGFYSEREPYDLAGKRWQSTDSAASQQHLKDVVTIRSSSNSIGRIWNAGGPNNSYTRGSRLFSLAGKPVWRNEEFQRIAEHEGHGAALAHAWTSRGAATFDIMTGGFAAAIIDHEAKTVLLAIDRMGIGRIAYRVNEAGIVFSSKVTDVADFSAPSPSIRLQGIFDYLFFHQVPSPGSIYEGIFKLGPAEYLVYGSGATETRRYWQPDFYSGNSAGRVSGDEMLQIVRHGVSQCMKDESVGTFLSGGLDSSTVTGAAYELRGPGVPAFSIGFDAEGFDEMTFASAVAERFLVDHRQYYVTCADVSASASLIAANCDEPFGNASIVPTHLCAKMARSNGCTSLLAGDGGDELFGGNERYAKQRVFELFTRFPYYFQSLMELLSKRCTDSRVAPLRKFASYVKQARIPLPDRLESYNLLTTMPISQIFTPDFSASVNSTEPLDLMRSIFHAADSASTLDKMLYLDWKLTLADNDLRKVSIGCELAGVTPKFPLLHLDLVDFSLKLGSSDKLHGNTLRPFFRKSVAQLLPESTLKKSKHGFGLPFGIWMKSDADLKTFTNDALNDFSRRNIVRPEFLNWLRIQHDQDHASYYGTIIWAIMMLELWMQNRGISY